MLASTWLLPVQSFSIPFMSATERRMHVVLNLEEPENLSSLSYDDADGTSKGIVSTLTAIVNSLSTNSRNETNRETTDQSTTSLLGEGSLSMSAPPTSPGELMERIQMDYVERNYLWTGDLDLSCFEEMCRFKDPTISFVGTDTFRKNTQNLVPLVNAFVTDCRSDLLSIQQSDDYIQTRWNMVGTLAGSRFLFWKPKIDVIGRTKFWFRPIPADSTGDGDVNNTNAETVSRSSSSPSFQVYYYDEEWEIPAYQALLQLLTPPGTFPNSQKKKS